MTSYIIIAAGEGTRWGNYKGVPKHIVKINGEPLLKRTVSLIRKNDTNSTVYVVAKGNDERYKVEGSAYYEAKLNPLNFDADKFLSSKELWNKKGRTVVVYGDCYFTDEAMKAIADYKDTDWTLFARYGPSSFTGCEWGECFAQSFYPDSVEKHHRGLVSLVEAIKNKVIDRCGGWEHYRWMVGADLKSHVKRGNFYEIDDFTDDFDYPEDYERWLKRFNTKK